MRSYCNLVEKRAAIMAEQAALLEQLAGDMYAIMHMCDEIKHKLEELEKEEDKHDKKANLSPPLHVLSGFNCYKYSSSIANEHDPVDIDMEEYLEETNCFSYYCGDDGIDADDAFCTGNGKDSHDMIHCMNAQLKEHFCSRRGCHRLGGRAAGH